MALKPPCDEGVVRTSEASAPCALASGPWILAATILGSAKAFIDGTVVNVALPEIQARLGATAVDAQWIVESYALLLAALILVGGSLGDHFGRRRIFALGICSSPHHRCGAASRAARSSSSSLGPYRGWVARCSCRGRSRSSAPPSRRKGEAGTTTAMNSVSGRHSGLASGVNNAVIRTGSLLAIPVLGIFVFTTFSAGLDARTAELDLPQAARQQLETEKVDLGGAEVPQGLDGGTATAVERAVDEAFVTSFRIAMLVAAGLALASAVAAGILIEGKGQAVRSRETERVGGETVPA
jgi:MFS family permease